MRLEHLAIWTSDLERLRAFYARHFGARSGARYTSASRPGFHSYFLEFPEGGARLELMTQGDLAEPIPGPARGYAHLALAAGSAAAVDTLVARLEAEGVRVLSQARWTGDGYYEAVIADPDGNVIEIVG